MIGTSILVIKGLYDYIKNGNVTWFVGKPSTTLYTALNKSDSHNSRSILLASIIIGIVIISLSVTAYRKFK